MSVYLPEDPREASLDGQTEQIVRRALRGESPAFSQLIALYERAALAVAFGCTGNSALAGDVVQEAFLRAWQRVGELKDAKKFGPWLCGIVRNLALDAARGRKREAAAVVEAAAGLSGAAGALDPADELARRDENARVSAALRELDEVGRTVIVLRYYEGMSSVQIAELIAATPAAVDMRLSRARQTLRQLLSESNCGWTCGAFEDR